MTKQTSESNSFRRGFTWVEWMIGVLVVLAIGFWIFSKGGESMEPARLKRTIGDLRSLASALEQFSEAHGGYPRSSYEEMVSLLTKQGYLETPVLLDAWKNPYLYQVHGGSDGETATFYTLRSLGADGILNAQDADGPYSPKDYKHDIVVGNGGIFRQWPQERE